MENTNETDVVKTYKVQGMADVDITVADAMKVLVQALKDDHQYRYSWQANIAMSFKDNWRWHYKDKEEVPFVPAVDLHEISNEAADYFLRLLES